MDFRRTALLLLAGWPLAAGALDLTPTPGFRELEGMKIPIVFFRDAARKISFQPPGKWSVSGEEAAATFAPAEPLDAVLQLRVRPKKPLASGPAEDLGQWSRSQLPQDAIDPVLEREALNPFMVDSKPSHEFVYSYAARGRRFFTAVAVVDWDETKRLVVIVTARASDFPAIHETAMRSMFSWTPVP